MTNHSPSLQTLLTQHFGFNDFREGQQEVIEKVLANNSALAIFPTGSGKSLCYQLAATQLPYLTLVVSPLLALMKDQLDFLKSNNIPAASIDSTLNQQEYNDVVHSLRNNQLKILMVSVERFKNERFRALIDGLSISLLVVDEAHCISEWGHNFRPDYLKLPQYQAEMNISQTLLLTATATRKVKQDMAARFNIDKGNIVQTGFYRPNLNLNVLPVDEVYKNSALMDYLTPRHSQCGIVYVTLQHTAEEVARFLQQNGLNALAYHAGLKDDARQRIQQAFMDGTTSVIVATIAFGMGIDKSNIRFVVHYNLPKSIENYSQEIGRAGRDNKPSDCVVLANLDAINTLENFVYGDTPELSGINAVIADIQSQQNQNSDNRWECQPYALSMLSNIRQLTLKTLIVQLELNGVIKSQYSYVAEYQIKLLTTQEAILADFNGERQRFLRSLLAHTQFKKTWGLVDIQGFLTDYPSDRKRVITALDYLKEKQLIDLKTSGVTEVYEVNNTRLLEPELASQLYSRFKQHETSEIARIQLLIRFLQSPQCLSNGLARYFDDSNAPTACGHCSVCKGNVAELSVSRVTNDFPEEAIVNQGTHFVRYLKEKGVDNISAVLVTRFLVGISSPLFSRYKVKSLGGFAVAQDMRYEKVLTMVKHSFDHMLKAQD